MVDVGNSSHGYKRQIVQHPPQHRINPPIVYLINLPLLELVIPALPANEVPSDQSSESEQARGAAPVDQRVAEEEVFDDVVVPAAHAEADVEDRPLPEVGGEVILFIWVGDEGVVGGHHGDVEVHKVTEEGGFVGTGVAGGD